GRKHLLRNETARKAARRNDHSVARTWCETRQCALYFVGFRRVERTHLYSEARRRRLDCAKLAGARNRRSTKHENAGSAGCNLLEKLKPFRADTVFDTKKSGRVGTRVCQTRY